MSLRTRLLIAIGVIALVALVVADVVTYSALESFLYQRVDQQLDQSQGRYVQEAGSSFGLVCINPGSSPRRRCARWRGWHPGSRHRPSRPRPPRCDRPPAG